MTVETKDAVSKDDMEKLMKFAPDWTICAKVSEIYFDLYKLQTKCREVVKLAKDMGDKLRLRKDEVTLLKNKMIELERINKTKGSKG